MLCRACDTVENHHWCYHGESHVSAWLRLSPPSQLDVSAEHGRRKSLKLMAKAMLSHRPYEGLKLIPVFLCALLPGCSGRDVIDGWKEDNELRMLDLALSLLECSGISTCMSSLCCSVTLGVCSSFHPHL